MTADEDEDESRQAGLSRRRVKLFSRNKTSGMLVARIIRTTKEMKKERIHCCALQELLFIEKRTTKP
jgi:hypothetical protein